MVTSLDDRLATLKAKGVPAGPTQGTTGLVKVATVTNLEGNRVTLRRISPVKIETLLSLLWRVTPRRALLPIAPIRKRKDRR